MELKVVRNTFTDESTIGDLYLNGEFFCYTLEDFYRPNGEKVYGKTAIPEGRYEIVINFSNKFKRELPLLLNVSNFKGIRIHPGNTAENTEGCILLGKHKFENRIGPSKQVFETFFKLLKESSKQEKHFILITSQQP